MRLSDYHERDGKQVWLDEDEVEMLLEEAQSAEQRRAFQLGARSGLRRSEIVSVTVADVLNGPDGFVRVWENYAKQEKYREAPIPDDLESVVTSSLQYERDGDEQLVDVDGSTVYRWVRRAAERLQAQTDDRGWSFLDVHDLRRTWGGQLLWNYGLLPSSVMAMGGWSDWETFRKHYLGAPSPEAMRRERAKVDWMGSDGISASETVSSVFEPKGSTRGNPAANY
jgi:integrase